ncbi:MAG: hypothetical protein M0R17_00285 [Candidatus Omnitrophica bacterium]|jgi:predicted nucleotidyltransferase|nr:hypothetical protein [Candidatus Omnitrophota bacterium]
MKVTDFTILAEDVDPDDIDISSLILRKELNPKIWNNFNLVPDVADTAKKIAKDYSDFMLKNLKDAEVSEIYFTGSLANYNWSNYSDFDIHVIIDYSDINKDIDLVGDYFWDRTLLYRLDNKFEISGFEVELNINNITPLRKNAGVYSLLYDEWVQKPDTNKIIIDFKLVKEKAAAIMNMIDDSRCDLNNLINIKEKIRKMRDSGIDKYGEFSIENLAFKILRRTGYIDKLKKEISEYSKLTV